MLTGQRALFLLDKWRQFIEECAECYEWDVSEYNNEIRVRVELEDLVNSDDFLKFDGRDRFLQDLFCLDRRLKDLFLPSSILQNRDTWWEQGVLARAGAYYRDYMLDTHGFNVNLCE